MGNRTKFLISGERVNGSAMTFYKKLSGNVLGSVKIKCVCGDFTRVFSFKLHIVNVLFCASSQGYTEYLST